MCIYNLLLSLVENSGVGDSSAVQQSQVSSSKPTTLPNDALGPILLEVRAFEFFRNSVLYIYLVKLDKNACTTNQNFDGD